MRRRLPLAATLILLLGAYATAPREVRAADSTAPRLAFPVACTPGRDCWLFHYFDHDPGAGWRDYACGTRSYDGHDGTDIAVRDLAAMERDVPVLAAAPGVVRRVRDGMADALYDPARPEAVQDRDCGNGVLVDHGGGWETQYCHLRRGSVRVRPGDAVTAGTVLGLIGLSGRTEFPHVEFRVLRNRRPVDPFVGATEAAGCGMGAGHLWAAGELGKLTYSPVDILATGFAAGAPDPEDAHAGRLNRTELPADSPALVAWATFAGVQRGDRLIVRLIGPDGSVLAENDRQLEQNKIRYFAYAGRRLRDQAWARGSYRAEVRLERPSPGGPILREATEVLTVR